MFWHPYVKFDLLEGHAKPDHAKSDRPKYQVRNSPQVRRDAWAKHEHLSGSDGHQEQEATSRAPYAAGSQVG